MCTALFTVAVLLPRITPSTYLHRPAFKKPERKEIRNVSVQDPTRPPKANVRIDDVHFTLVLELDYTFPLLAINQGLDTKWTDRAFALQRRAFKQEK